MNKVAFFTLCLNSSFIFPAESSPSTSHRKKFVCTTKKVEKTTSPKTSPKISPNTSPETVKRNSLKQVKVESFGTEEFITKSQFAKEENITFETLKRSSGDSK